MAETYHGIEIPDDLWQDWADPNASEVSGWRRGVRAAIQPDTLQADLEMTRLGALARARDEAEPLDPGCKHAFATANGVTTCQICEGVKTDG
jgi:hypothetical protein